MEPNIAKTLENLRANGFQALYFANKEEAAAWLCQQVQKGEKVAFGGSVTLRQLHLREGLEQRGVLFLDPYATKDPKKQREILRQAFFADAYFTSANALTEEGFLFNVDGRGNRVAASLFGPERVYTVVGKNKLCADLAAAQRRLADIAAPLNAKRLGCQTPCAITGKCVDCQGSTRICRLYVELRQAPRDTASTVVIIGEDLGY